MDDDSRALDKGWDALPDYAGAGDAEEAVTVSISTAPGEWLVNTTDSVVVPMSMAEVVDGLRTGKLTDHSLVWRNGMQEWQQVARVPQLKLAARLPSTPSVAAPRPTPPPKPRSSSTAPQGTPRQTLSPEAKSSPFASSRPRASRPTLPPPSSAAHARPSRPRFDVPTAPSPSASADEGVLAVYARPAATISFELAADEAPSTRPPASSAAPETLAPTTTEAASPRPAFTRNADLSVVAASHFREQRRSSQRLIWISSLGSAAAASLLTLWLSGGPTTARGAAEPVLVMQSLSALSLPSVPLPPPPPPVVEPVASVEPTASKPKAKRKARRQAPRVAAAPVPGVQDPSSEPNPYDVKLVEDPAAPEPSPTGEAPSEGSGAVDASPSSEATDS